MNIVLLDRETIPTHIHFPELSFDHQWFEHAFTPAEEVAQRIEHAVVVISNKVRLDESNLANAKQLKLIVVAATGVNNVDLDYCHKQGIAVCNVQGYATRSVPEHVIAMLFTLRRNLLAYHQDVQAGKWGVSRQFCFLAHPINDVAGSTMGIIGSGALGQSVAKLAQAIGMNVLFAERKGQTHCREAYLPFEEVLRQADVVSLHCPLNNETQNLIGESELALMKANATLINTGRGGLVDERALIRALKVGEIGAAGFDVATQEPAPDSNPLVENSNLPNLLITPHVAWGSDSAITRLCEIVIENIEAFVAGEELNRVV
ncbi:D-2-hydroxyacid dehydrogenase [Vibrio tapetis]|nr:D-2-hydroxyacid dehydrogenase [Vibrio tapetis]